MATRAELRTILRRRIHDVPGVQWSDAELNDLLNLAYAKVQKEVVKVLPTAHLFWDRINIVAATAWYPMPESSFGIRRVGLLDPTTGLYTKLRPKDYEDIRESNLVTTYYSLMGQWIGIFPVPTANLVAGLEVIHSPLMAMAIDADVPRVKVPIHDAIADWAVVLCLGETDEAAAEAKARLQDMINDLPFWYDVNNDEPVRLRVEA